MVVEVRGGFVAAAIICNICSILPAAIVREHSLRFQPFLSLLITAEAARAPSLPLLNLRHSLLPAHRACEAASVWLRVPTWPWLTLTWACCLTPLTVIVDVLRPVERYLRGVGGIRGVEFQQKIAGKHHVIGGAVGAVGGIAADWKTNALLPQVAHEELQADEGKDTEAENGEDHDVWQLLYRLDQCTNYGLQTFKI